jgi:hypothetical protein
LCRQGSTHRACTGGAPPGWRSDDSRLWQ